MDNKRNIIWEFLINATIYEKNENNSVIIFKNLVVCKQNIIFRIFCWLVDHLSDP
jgi:hypothetical protein